MVFCIKRRNKSDFLGKFLDVEQNVQIDPLSSSAVIFLQYLYAITLCSVCVAMTQQNPFLLLFIVPCGTSSTFVSQHQGRHSNLSSAKTPDYC
jgi:hypothetical protein